MFEDLGLIPSTAKQTNNTLTATTTKLTVKVKGYKNDKIITEILIVD
jgi:hypothetical protein